MKYTIFINQAGIVDAGLHKSTDFIDWALLEYVSDWQLHGRAHRMNDHVWLNYAHLMDEMPMLGLNAKNSVSNRVKKLVNLNLLSVLHDEDSRVFMKLTDFYLSVTAFRSEVVKTKKSNAPSSVPAQEPPVPAQDPPVPAQEPPVPAQEPPVPAQEPPVPVQEHTINNQIINNQDKNNSVELPPKDLAVLSVFDHWRMVMGHEKSVLDKKRRTAIKNALAWGYSLDVLKQAISGCANTPHNMGQNDSGQRYDGIELILRNADQVDRFVRNFHHPPATQAVKQRLEDWENIPRDDAELVPWMNRLGYGNPRIGESFQQVRSRIRETVNQKQDERRRMS